MNILSFLKPKKQKRLVSVNDFNSSLGRHYRFATESLVTLRDTGVEEEDELKIDYFFYSDSPEKAQKLEKEIKKMDFIVNSEPAPHDKNLIVISGTTPSIKMMHESLSKWVTEMSELAFKHDCSFDSWKIVN